MKVKLCVGLPGCFVSEEIREVNEEGLRRIKEDVNDMELHGFYACYKILEE